MKWFIDVKRVNTPTFLPGRYRDLNWQRQSYSKNISYCLNHTKLMSHLYRNQSIDLTVQCNTCPIWLKSSMQPLFSVFCSKKHLVSRFACNAKSLMQVQIHRLCVKNYYKMSTISSISKLFMITAWKMSVFKVFLVRIFPHSESIFPSFQHLKNSEYDTFHAYVIWQQNLY